MSPNVIGKFIETVGVPVAISAAALGLLWWLLKWLTQSLCNQISDVKSEIKDETGQVAKQIVDLRIITIRLVDRIRVLERNSMLAHTTMLVKLGCKIPNFNQTREERHAELQEQIKDVGMRNGDANE